MRSMALASAPVCYLLLVLKLANCSLRCLWHRIGYSTWFALCLGKSNTHTECQVVCFIFVPLPLSPTATARRLCLYACLLESTEARPLMNSNAHTLVLPSILPFLPFFSSLWITGHPQPLKEEPTSALDMINMMWSEPCSCTCFCLNQSETSQECSQKRKIIFQPRNLGIVSGGFEE